MVNLRKFCISDELFSGFETMVDLDEVQSIDGIIKDVLNNAFVVLRQNKFRNLINLLRNKVSSFHIHDYSFGEILISNPNYIFYICCHSNC